MPIDSKHPEFVQNYPKWERCRDAFDGSDAIKLKGPRYLPRLTKQKPREYEAYKRRALFYAITSKTVSALVGMATIRQPVVKFPTGMEAYYEEDKGCSFMEIFSKVLEENLLMGRIALFVDMPLLGGDEADIIAYNAESIINWKVDSDKDTPSMVILEEWYDSQGKDEYEIVKDVRYRKLWLDGGGKYWAQVFSRKGEPMSAPIQPTIRGQAMDHIPFWVANPIGLGFDCVKSPMIDIVDINLSHYMSSADLEHGRHFTALPTPYVTGVSSGSELSIGSTTAWMLPDPSSKAGFLEFTGQGLQSLEKALAEKQSQLASLSARIMDNSKRGSESSDVVRLRFTSETASLASVVRASEALLTAAYKEVALIEEVNPDEVSIELNKEFLDSKLKPSEVVDLVDSYLKGGITTETLVYNLRRGDVIPVSADDAAEVTAIESLVSERVKATQQVAKPPTKPTIN